MPILRLKVKRQQEQEQEQRISKVRDLMEMFKVPGMPTYQYQPIGASSSSTIDPKIQKTKDLFEMFHLAR